MALPAEYEKNRAVSQSDLRKWKKDKSAMDLAPVEPKQIFSHGDLFERMAGGKPWAEKYGICDWPQQCPDELVSAIERGASSEEYRAMYVYNKNGERNGTKKTLHFYLDWILSNHSKYPVSACDMDKIQKLANSAYLVRPFEKVDEVPAGDRLLRWSQIVGHCEYQKPIAWEYEGIEKKGLLDFYLRAGEYNLIFDTKWTRSKDFFVRAIRSDGWIQAVHYTEGCETLFGGKSIFVWIVGPHQEPFQSFAITLRDAEMAREKYLDMCQEYASWDRAGRIPAGFGEAVEIKPFI